MCGLFIQSNSVFNEFIFNVTESKFLNQLHLLEYDLMFQYNIICLSETYLDSDTSHEDANLEIVGYTLIRANHPSNTKRGGACLYYRNSPAFRLLKIQYLEECINFEISFAGKVCSFTSSYRSPNQSHDTFETFVDNLKLNLDTIANKNLYQIVILGDFNAKSLKLV